jgi:hypothetical protein
VGCATVVSAHPATCFGEIPERTVLLARTRKDAKLCFRAAEDSRRFYAADKFSPEQVRQDEKRAWKTTKVFYGGKRRKIRYKEVSSVYWQRGARQRPLRLIVIAPTPYRKSQSKKLYYRDPAYPLTSDLRSSLKQLLQIYFDRWQIEVNHRKRRTPWEWAKRSYGTLLLCPNSRSWRSPPTALCYWHLYWPLALSVETLMPSSPSGAAMPDDLPAWISSRSSARKWHSYRNCSLPSASQSPTQPWFRLPPPEKC